MLNPEGHKVVVRPDKVEEMSEGGIILVDETKDREHRASTQGTIVGLGPDVILSFHDTAAMAGDRVLYVQYAGVIYKEDGDEYWIMNDEDILGILS